MIVRMFLSICLILVSACGIAAPPAAETVSDEPFAEIERRTGGRLGLALVDAGGRLLISHRADERFPLCSTFKLPLAAMVLTGAAAGRWSLQDRLPLVPGDMLTNSPHAERALPAGATQVQAAAEAIVTLSDNTSANLLLRRTGGPAALTSWLRASGDPVTRLDRFELELNENRPGDPRDTTSPTAMARTVADLVYGELLTSADRERIRRWTAASRTGTRRIRAGLPPQWPAGDKTGSCGTAYNDVAWFDTPDGLSFVLAVYLDRPTAPAAQAEAAVAEVARSIVPRVVP